MSQITHFSSVKFLAWKSGCVKFWTNIMSGRTKKMKKVVFATKMGTRKKSILAIFKKKLAILFSGKMLFLRQFLPEPINRQSPFIFLARSSGVSPLGK